MGTGEPKLEKINKTGTQMRAELQGDSFTIAPLFTADAAEQPIVGDYAQWEWKVIPLVDGNQTLRLCVDAIIEIPGYNDRSTPVRVFEKVIRVKINPIYTIGTFLENNWQWIITTILSTGILSLLWRNFRKKDKNS